MWQTKPRLGFTFIEILVTTAIIGVLMSVAVVAFVQVSQSGRDSRRKKDLATIQTALEIYRASTGSYPASCGGSCSPANESDSDWIPALVPDYIDALPVDPQQASGNGYTYTYQLSSGAYTLTGKLENGSAYVVNSPK